MPEPDLAPSPLLGNLTREQQTRVEHIQAWQKAAQVPDAQLCKAAHKVTQPAWSALKVGNYKVSPKARDAILDRLDRAKETIRTTMSGSSQEAESFLETETWQELKDSVDLCLQLARAGSDQRLTALFAPSRHGKTKYSGELVKLYTGITINAKIHWKASKLAVFRDIAAGLALSDKGGQGDLNKRIKGYFSSPKLLIVNELGPTNCNPWFVAWMREIINDTKAVVVLCGVPELEGYLASKMQDELVQLEQRGTLIRSKPITAAHVQWFAARADKTLSAEVAKTIAEAANEFGSGGYNLVKTIAHLSKPIPDAATAKVAAAAFRESRHYNPAPRRTYTRHAA